MKDEEKLDYYNFFSLPTNHTNRIPKIGASKDQNDLEAKKAGKTQNYFLIPQTLHLLSEESLLERHPLS